MRTVDGLEVAANVIEQALGIKEAMAADLGIAANSGFVSGGDVRLRDELRERDADKDENCSGCRAQAEPFASEDEGGNPRKNGLEGEQQGDVR